MNTSQPIRSLAFAIVTALILFAGLTRSIGIKAEQIGLATAASIYDVHGIDQKEQRSAIAATGVDILEVGADYVVISATPEQIDRIRQLGFAPDQLATAASLQQAVDPGYHTYDQMVAELHSYAITYTNLMQLITIGLSYEGRPIWAAEISDNPGVDESEPEVLFTFHQHAREHLTVEQGLYALHLLVDNYLSSTQITQLVNARVIWLVFDLNPDGGEYDTSGGTYQYWRKNRQPTPTAGVTGIDLNRNWGYHWGSDNFGSSPNPADETYRGPSAFSAPETHALEDFVVSRVISGVQRIKVAIDFHTYSELVLWPYGYTYDSLPPDMLQRDYDIMQTMGTAMAQLNGYTPEQASQLYLTNGTIDDWLYGVYHIYAFTFEMYPNSDFPGFYPPSSVIAAQTERNREPILYAIDVAGDPDRVLPIPHVYLPIVLH